MVAFQVVVVWGFMPSVRALHFFSWEGGGCFRVGEF